MDTPIPEITRIAEISTTPGVYDLTLAVHLGGLYMPEGEVSSNGWPRADLAYLLPKGHWGGKTPNVYGYASWLVAQQHLFRRRKRWHIVRPERSLSVMRGASSFDQRVKAFLARRFASSPRALDYYVNLWEGHFMAGLVNEHFVSELTGGSDYVFFQRVWEMRLARHLKACGHNISSRSESEPDFRFEHNGVVVWVEAVSPQPGPDLPPEWVPSTVETVPHK